MSLRIFWGTLLGVEDVLKITKIDYLVAFCKNVINASFVIPSSFSLSAINYLLLLSKSALPTSTCALSELTYFV